MRYLPDLAWLVDWNFLMVLMTGGIIKFTFFKETYVNKNIKFWKRVITFQNFFYQQFVVDAFSVSYLHIWQLTQKAFPVRFYLHDFLQPKHKNVDPENRPERLSGLSVTALDDCLVCSGENLQTRTLVQSAGLCSPGTKLLLIKVVRSTEAFIVFMCSTYTSKIPLWHCILHTDLVRGGVHTSYSNAATCMILPIKCVGHQLQ